MTLEPRPWEQGDATADPGFLSLIFEQELSDEKKAAQEPLKGKKIELFEQGLAQELKTTDTVDEAFSKVIKVALAVEFGLKFVKEKGTQKLIEALNKGIMSDHRLRKQALMIVDRFAKEPAASRS